VKTRNEKILERFRVHESDDWLTLELGESGDGFAISKRTHTAHRMRGRAVDDEPMEPTPERRESGPPPPIVDFAP
jgi:hypothetical protein